MMLRAESLVTPAVGIPSTQPCDRFQNTRALASLEIILEAGVVLSINVKSIHPESVYIYIYINIYVIYVCICLLSIYVYILRYVYDMEPENESLPKGRMYRSLRTRINFMFRLLVFRDAFLL